MIRIAREVWVDSWDSVKYAYVHGEGAFRQFSITVVHDDGSPHTIAVRGDKEIESTLRLWRASEQGASLIQGAEPAIPESISQWIPIAGSFGLKRIPRR